MEISDILFVMGFWGLISIFSSMRIVSNSILTGVIVEEYFLLGQMRGHLSSHLRSSCLISWHNIHPYLVFPFEGNQSGLYRGHLKKLCHFFGWHTHLGPLLRQLLGLQRFVANPLFVQDNATAQKLVRIGVKQRQTPFEIVTGLELVFNCE